MVLITWLTMSNPFAYRDVGSLILPRISTKDVSGFPKQASNEREGDVLFFLQRTIFSPCGKKYFPLALRCRLVIRPYRDTRDRRREKEEKKFLLKCEWTLSSAYVLREKFGTQIKCSVNHHLPDNGSLYQIEDSCLNRELRQWSIFFFLFFH